MNTPLILFAMALLAAFGLGMWCQHLLPHTDRRRKFSRY